MSRSRWQLLMIIFIVFGMAQKSYARPDSCGGPSALLQITDRPTMALSPCTVPFKQAVFEQGFQAQKLVYRGQAQVFPDEEFRLGMPADSEIHVILPSYLYQTLKPHSGFGAVTIGYKHMLSYGANWLFTTDTLISPPSGSFYYGRQGFGGILSGIFFYSFTDSLSLTAELTYSTLTESRFYGGERYNSLSPDVYLTYSLRDKLLIYGELYGQSKTGAGQGAGLNVDAGFVYLLKKNITLDLEAGQRLNGFLNSVENYYGIGTTLLFE